MYDTAEAFAKACGYSAIWLESAGRFKAAKALYERNGFAAVGRVDNQFEDEVMVKSIAPVGGVVGAPTGSAQAGRAAAAGALPLGGEAHASGEAAPLTRKQASAAAAARFRARKAAKAEAERAAKLSARRAEIAANVAKAIAERDDQTTLSDRDGDADRSVEAPGVERSIEAPEVTESEPQPEAQPDGR